MKKLTIIDHGDTLKLNKICFGTDKFTNYSKNNSDEILDFYLKRSNFLDCARIYGDLNMEDKGGCEEILGNYLNRRNNKNQVIISTKGGHPFRNNMHSDRLDNKSLKHDLELSLKFLDRDYIDIYFLHRDSGRDLYDVMKTLNSFIKSGKVRFLGASNWTLNRILEANRIAEECGFAKFSLSQICYSLAKTTSKLWNDDTLIVMNDEMKEAYRYANIPVMAFSAQAKGYFSKTRKQDNMNTRFFERYNLDINKKRAKRVWEVADKYNVDESAVAIRYLIDLDLPVIPIISSSKLSQIISSFDINKFELSQKEIEYLRV